MWYCINNRREDGMTSVKVLYLSQQKEAFLWESAYFYACLQ